MAWLRSATPSSAARASAAAPKPGSLSCTCLCESRCVGSRPIISRKRSSWSRRSSPVSRWRPTASPGYSGSASTAAAASSRRTIRLALVTMPSRCAAKTPSFTVAERPRSSALTMRNRSVPGAAAGIGQNFYNDIREYVLPANWPIPLWKIECRGSAHGAGDHHALDLVRALVDLGDLGVAHHPRARVLVDVAVTAENLDRLDRHLHRVVGGEELGHRGPLAEGGGALGLVGHRAGFVEELAGGSGAGLHVGELELDRLQLVDRLAEGDPLGGVAVGVVGRALGDPDRLGGGAEAGALQGAEGDGEALTLLADQVLVRDADVGEGRRAGRRALDPELVLELAGVEAGRVLLDHEGAGAAILAVGGGEDDVEVGDRRVGDPGLLAVDHPLVAVAHRAGPHRRRVGARLGLREREGRRPLAAGALRQPALFLLLGAEQLDRQRPQLLHHQHQRRGGAGLGDLLDRHLQDEGPGAGPAVLGSEGQAEDVMRGEQLPQVPRVFAPAVDVAGPRRDLLLGELADHVAQVKRLLGDLVGGGDDIAAHSFLCRL